MKPYKNASFLIIFLFSIQATFSLDFETAQQPYIEFTTEQFQHHKTIKLDQHWEFYWKDFINPGNFNHPKLFDSVSLTSWTNYKDTNNKPLPSFGYATYRLQFSIPKGRPSTSLYIPLITASSKIWVNGVFILETGLVGTTKSKTLHRSFTKIIPLDSQETNFEVVIQVANFYHKKGGITTPILLGTTDQLFQKKSLQIMTDMISIGSFSFIGILFLVFYLLYWSKDQAVLYFSILCICMAYHTLNERYAPLAIVFSKLSWVFLVKLEYISSYLAGLFASLFFCHNFKRIYTFLVQKNDDNNNFYFSISSASIAFPLFYATNCALFYVYVAKHSLCNFYKHSSHFSQKRYFKVTYIYNYSMCHYIFWSYLIFYKRK